MMIKITGEIDYVGEGFVIVMQGGIGYKVILPLQVAIGLSGKVSLYTHEVLREDAHQLFGFFSMDALDLFWKLISVSGVGCKTAQKIVFHSNEEDVKAHIMQGDIEFLTSTPGIGKKTAQKIILELKGVLAEETKLSSVDQESLDALVSLGYSRAQATNALCGIIATETEDRIKIALRLLAKS